MYQKDYILRLIEQAAKVLAAILGLIKGGDLHKAAEDLWITSDWGKVSDYYHYSRILKMFYSSLLRE